MLSTVEGTRDKKFTEKWYLHAPRAGGAATELGVETSAGGPGVPWGLSAYSEAGSWKTSPRWGPLRCVLKAFRPDRMGAGRAQSRPGIAAGGDFREGLVRRHSRSVSATC